MFFHYHTTSCLQKISVANMFIFLAEPTGVKNSDKINTNKYLVLYLLRRLKLYQLMPCKIVSFLMYAVITIIILRNNTNLIYRY